MQHVSQNSNLNRRGTSFAPVLIVEGSIVSGFRLKDENWIHRQVKMNLFLVGVRDLDMILGQIHRWNGPSCTVTAHSVVRSLGKFSNQRSASDILILYFFLSILVGTH